MTLGELEHALKQAKKMGVPKEAEVLILSETDPLRVMQVSVPPIAIEKNIDRYKMVSLGFTKAVMTVGFVNPVQEIKPVAKH